ncbi:HIT family protein [Chryseobacterium sp. G0240]|uniref:HIT family protein n=1 Tax=Chryseobacterium sp. G0240 TaxID=2487066 RepID=UPI000F4571C1|nr:HIT family protein [Chryseobacterium sp. G0240]ROI06567.1 HIT family protein [Chryseobacterium sp. G0240]
MKDFTEITEDKIIYRGKYFFIIEDGFPVSPGHLLIISNEVKTDFFALNEEEKYDLPSMIEKAKEIVLSQYHPDAFNIGMNCGADAGQTVFHFHCHVIPRYKGDMDNPRGGVRHVIPGKGSY